MSDLPQRKPLSEDEVRQLLRECVTVVKPGETLVILAHEWMTPVQMRELQDTLNWIPPEGEPYFPFRVLVVPGAELGVVEAPEGSDA